MIASETYLVERPDVLVAILTTRIPLRLASRLALNGRLECELSEPLAVKNLGFGRRTNRRHLRQNSGAVGRQFLTQSTFFVFGLLN